MANYKSTYQRVRQVLLHSFFWVLVLLFFWFMFGADNTLDSNVLLFSLFMMPVTVATTYVSIYKLIPDYLIPKRYIQFTVYSVYTLIISVFAVFLSGFFAMAYLTNFTFGKLQSISRSALYIMICIYLVVIIVSAFKLLKLNLKQSKTNAQLEAKILEAQLKLKEQELSYLKMQIHPHFLFNTLNTLYGFALKKSESTPEMILKLSNLLDYLLYQVDKPSVLLTDEIHHIKDYIALEKMRFNKTLNVAFNADSCTKTITLAPMLFLPFVENSFKHGKIRDGILDITINFECTENSVNFGITNTHENTDTNKTGIGLENIKKRLELLYKDQYDLQIFETETNFEVQLKLKLKHE
ncbi:MAG: histidine kinase [Winogradskyella sp.]|uniref:sensor histidine kinase n=1 Tax=Winogradskyella sp. TaxID=1883156 RepID=UPI000F3CA3EC|nr:histidine kinase [Winogradskyella sp.]RNC87049.1 MAG: histidine kinase [Winogradskyella sp.]